MVAEQESVERDPSRYIRNQRQGAFVPCLWFLLPHDDRLSKTGNGQAAGTYGYQAGTHWLTSIGSGARRYDNAGNTTGNSAAGETWGYGYDGKNRMTVVQRDGSTVAMYTYNAFGERVAKAVTLPQTINERFVYNENNQLIAELGSTNKDYIWLGDLPIGVVDTVGGTSTINYVTADGLNTPRAIADKSGRTIWTWSVVGNPLGEQPPTSTTGYVYNPRFPGQYFDQETGFNYNVFRSFDPTTGRYTQVDPMGFAGGQPGLYPYGNNNPLSNIDPLGLQIAGTVNNDNVNWNARAADNVNLFGYLLTGTDIDLYISGGSGAIQPVSTPFEFMAAGGIARGVGAASRAMCGSPTYYKNLFPADPIDTPKFVPLNRLAGISGNFNYVITTDGELVVGRTGHTSLSGGANVQAAGEVQLYNGNIKWIDNASGHYQPSGSTLQSATEKAFNNIGLDATGKFIYRRW